MYEVDSRKFTSKPNPKTEFEHYFKESGAAAALQKAMLSLYKMPVKQTNLAEFFYQYFENGAMQLLRISLLKAELCYKRDELKNRMLKVNESENYVRQMVEKLQITDEEFNQRFLPERIKEKHRLSVMERYLRDVESKISKKSREGLFKTSSFGGDPKIEIETDSNYDLENHCLKNVRSEHALQEDIKELDPYDKNLIWWGIICKGSKIGEEGKKATYADKPHDDVSEIHDDDHEADEDDAASLAEYFQQSSRDWIVHDNDEGVAKLHNQLLMVKHADKIRMTDFMGWTPLVSRENLVIPASSTFREDPLAQDNLKEGEHNMESLKRRPCLEQKVNLYASLKNADVSLHELDTDAFLLEEDHIEHAYKLMESNQEHFEYELQKHARVQKESRQEDICYPVCELADLHRICSPIDDSFDDSLTYGGEDELEYPTENESLGFVPGKMTNWTTQYAGYPFSSSAGEYFQFHEKHDRIKQKNKSDEETPLDVPLARLDSSCHCVLTGIYDTDEMLSEDAKETTAEAHAVAETDTGRKPTKKGGKPSHQKDEATLTEDSALETELQDVFKHKQVRRSLNKEKTKKAAEEAEEITYGGDAFGIDLAKEVKRTILGIKPSETSNASVETEYVGRHHVSPAALTKLQGHHSNTPASFTSRGVILPGQR